MSLAIAEPPKPKFLARFDHVWAALKRYQIRQGAAWSFLIAALGVITLVAADYRLELIRSVRAGGLVALSAVILVVLWARVISPLRWWTKRRTAAEIEARFPQLGQRIRTVVQYAGLPDELIHSEGVTPSLVDALEEETEVRAQPLPLERVVPWRRVWAIGAVATAFTLGLLIAAAVNPEVRIALARAFLSRRPYTTLAVSPGNITVEQGDNVALNVQLMGRLKRDVVLYTRPAAQPDSAWNAAALDIAEKGSASQRESKLEKVKEPLDYRVVAGPASSPIYRIGVRYPLALKSFDVALKPPAYTGVAPSTVKGGDLRVIEGTGATFEITFDSPPAEASLVVADPSVRSKKDKTPASKVIPLKANGTKYTTEINLTKSLAYQIEAKTSDGRALPKNAYKIDVQEDRAPRVAFEQPDEALEVHPIAEVLNRIRVGDDFGLTKAGIVFQFNAGDDKELIVQDFKSEPGKSRTTAALEEMLLLEKLAATPTDSLSYYAFAEDNYPSGARRTETELRYVDIRPFKREYKMRDGEGGMEATDEFTSLGELIARQRFNLNRANRLAKHKPSDRTIAEDPLKIAGFEETLAGLTREFTEGVEGIVGERIEPLHAAEESMLGAIRALDHGLNAQAPPHMSLALRHLIEARNTLQIAIGQDAAAARAMRGFDRTQAQKIRKPKKDAEEAEEIVQELEQLADDEDFVYATLAALTMAPQPTETKEDPKAAPQEGDAEQKEEPADKKDEPKKSDKTKKGQKGNSPGQGKGSAGDGKGRAGEKGEPDDQDNDAEPKKSDRRAAMERQEKIADKARELEEKLKKLEVASDLAKVRMTKAAETTEKASGALNRGNTKEAAETAKAGAGMLHELARQVKGEIARDVAQELAMARDLADELAEREAELGRMPQAAPGSGGEQNGEEPQSGKGDKGKKGQGGKDDGQDPESEQADKGEKGQSGEGNGEGPQSGKGDKGEKGQDGSPGKDGQGAPGTGGRGGLYRGGWGDLTDAERLERMQEAGKTLDHWLRVASVRAVGKWAEQIRELLEESETNRVVERMERIGELYLGGQKPAARRDAKDLSRMLEVLSRQLDVLHRGIVAPELAALVEYDKRVTELIAKLKTLKTDAEITEWHRMAATLVRDLEKAGLTAGAAALEAALEAGGWHGGASHWDWAFDTHGYRAVPVVYTNALGSVTAHLHDKIQDLILKDMASARDEATPPEYKELVERYYEVLSKSSGSK